MKSSPPAATPDWSGDAENWTLTTKAAFAVPLLCQLVPTTVRRVSVGCTETLSSVQKGVGRRTWPVPSAPRISGLGVGTPPVQVSMTCTVRDAETLPTEFVTV